VDEIVDLFLYKLCQKGLTPAEILRLVKDILIILREDGGLAITTINHQLETLGWDNHRSIHLRTHHSASGQGGSL
jgi:hypothetical protein